MYPSGAAQVSGSNKLPVSACANKSSCHCWNVKLPQPQELGGLSMEFHDAPFSCKCLPLFLLLFRIGMATWGWRLVLPGSYPELWCSLALWHHFSWGHASLQWVTESSREGTLPLWNISSESFTCDFRGGKIDPKYVSPPRALNLASKCWLGKGWELTQNVSSAASKQDGSRATAARANPVVLSPHCTTSAYVLQHS